MFQGQNSTSKAMNTSSKSKILLFEEFVAKYAYSVSIGSHILCLIYGKVLSCQEIFMYKKFLGARNAESFLCAISELFRNIISSMLT